MSALEKVDKSIKILVVDDHEATLMLVKSILKSAGFLNVTLVENVEDAKSELQIGRAHMVICDWNMPEKSGIEFLREVRKHSRFKWMPFLMLTAEAYRENIQEALQAGVTDYIVKPFTSDVLLTKVADAWMNRPKED